MIDGYTQGNDIVGNSSYSIPDRQANSSFVPKMPKLTIKTPKIYQNIVSTIFPNKASPLKR